MAKQPRFVQVTVAKQQPNTVSGDLKPYSTLQLTPAKTREQKSVRRAAISAAPLSENDLKKHKKVVIPKDKQTREHLECVMSKNVLFAHLDEKEKSEIYDAMFPVEKKPNDIIVKQGDEGDNFYVVESGECEVLVDGNRTTTITSGGSFGELALINNAPRAATVKALTATKLWGLDSGTYKKVLMGNQMLKRQKYQEALGKVKVLVVFTFADIKDIFKYMLALINRRLSTTINQLSVRFGQDILLFLENTGQISSDSKLAQPFQSQTYFKLFKSVFSCLRSVSKSGSSILDVTADVADEPLGSLLSSTSLADSIDGLDTVSELSNDDLFMLLGYADVMERSVSAPHLSTSAPERFL